VDVAQARTAGCSGAVGLRRAAGIGPTGIGAADAGAAGDRAARDGAAAVPARAGRLRRGRVLAGRAAADRFTYGGGQVGGAVQQVVPEEVLQSAGIALADCADLPGLGAAVQLDGHQRVLGVQVERGVGDQLGAVVPGHRDERGGRAAETGRGAGQRRQRQKDRHMGDRARQRLQVDGEPMLGRRLPGDLDAVRRGLAGVQDLLGDAPATGVRVQQNSRQHRHACHDPHIDPGPGQGVVLSPYQFGRHRCSPSLTADLLTAV
jgi:hypothetical protein